MPVTILIVEDHDEVRTALGDWLSLEFPNCRLLQAATAEAALVLFQCETPHLVVMDISLPGISGIDATRQIKATLPSVRIVMLTVHQDEIHRAAATAAGASGFISKSSMSIELIPTLVALLGDDFLRCHRANRHDLGGKNPSSTIPE